MLKFCEWCETDFQANVSYQIYCSVDCRSYATKHKSTLKQKERRAKSRINKERLCTTCGKQLSIYNDETFCSSCIGSKKDYKKFLRNLK